MIQNTESGLDWSIPHTHTDPTMAHYSVRILFSHSFHVLFSAGLYFVALIVFSPAEVGVVLGFTVLFFALFFLLRVTCDLQVRFRGANQTQSYKTASARKEIS